MANADELARLAAVIPLAQESARRWKVPAAVTLAQWCTESSWGGSRLAQTANNDFGIKYSHLNAMETYVEFPTWEYEGGQKVLVPALFARFSTVDGCFDAHGRLLATATRYKPAMAVAAQPNLFAQQLQKCGYSTSPRYAVDLAELMREHNLYQYDVSPAPPGALSNILAHALHNVAPAPPAPALPASPNSQVS